MCESRHCVARVYLLLVLWKFRHHTCIERAWDRAHHHHASEVLLDGRDTPTSNAMVSEDCNLHYHAWV